MSIEEIKTIRNTVREKGYQWSAGLTALSKLPKEEVKKYLGLEIEEKEIERMTIALAEEDALAASEGIAYTYPPQWDWRNVYGRDWTTPIKDQGPCGSCVAFATVAIVESNLEIFRRNPYLNPNLSEADLFFCGCGKCCGTGWNFAPALNYVRDKGIPDETCFPYMPSDQPCKPCTDRDRRIIKIQTWREICNVSLAKDWIYKKGPVMTGMKVYEDFIHYRGGIYKHTTGNFLGLHAIAVVGYNDVDRYWICKNSWGTSWGERGWFRIAYGECGIGTNFCFYTAEFPSLKDDIIMPKTGKVVVKFKSRQAAFDNEFRLYRPVDKSIFMAINANVGKTFEVGTFSAGTRLIFALKTPEGFTYYTDHSLNADACDHVIKVQTGVYKWELRWEDLYGLGDKDYNDVVVEVEVV
jgi:C1A family cysteine protease